MPTLFKPVEPAFQRDVEVEREDQTTFSQDLSNFADLAANRWSDVFNQEDFKPLEGYNIMDEKYSYLWDGVGGNVKRAVLEAEPESPAETQFYIGKYTERLGLQDSLSLDGGLAWTFLSELITPESVAATIATAGLNTMLNVGFKGAKAASMVNAVNNSRMAKTAALTVAGEAGYAAGTAAFREETTQEEMMHNALIGMTIGGTLSGILPASYSRLKDGRPAGDAVQAMTNDLAVATGKKKPKDLVGMAPTLYKLMATAESETLNKVGDALFSTPISKRHGEYQLQAVDVAKDTKFTPLQRKASREAYEAHTAYNKERGIANGTKAADDSFRAIQDEIYEHLAVKEGSIDEIADANVRKIAQSIRNMYDEGIKAAKKGGVLGANEVEAGANYFQRRWNRDLVMGLKNQLGDSFDSTMLTGISKAISQGYMKAGRQLPDEDIVNAMARAVLRRSVEIGDAAGRSANDIDVDDMYRLLKDMDADDALIKRTIQQLNRGADSESRMGYLSGRMPMDLSVSITGDARVADLMRRDVFFMGQQYMNTMMGAGELAARGFDSPKALAKVRDQIKKELDASKMVESDRTRALSEFDKGLNEILGQPRDAGNIGMSDRSKRNLLRLRQFTSTAMLNNMVAAAVPETTAMAFRTGFLATASQMPIIRNWTHTNRASLAKEFEKAGIYFENSRFEGLYSHYYTDGLEESGHTVDRLLNNATNGKYGLVNMSGIGQFDAWSRKTSFMNFADDVFRQAIGKRSRAKVTYQELGLKKTEWDQILEYMRKSRTTSKGTFGRDVEHFNLDNWKKADGTLDYLLQDKFVVGLHKLTNSAILRGTVGERIPLVDNPMGHIFMQFKNMLALGLDKGGVSAIRNRDMVTVVNFFGGIVGCFVANELKLAMKGAGNQEKYDELREKYSGYENLKKVMETGSVEDAVKAIAYTVGYSKELGGFMEVTGIASSLILGYDLSGRRVNASDKLLGTPAFGVFENMRKGMSALGEGDFETAVDKFSYAVPLLGSPVIHAFSNALMSD